MMIKSTRLNVLVPLIGIISLAGMPSLSADIYKSVDKNGVVTFSDTPPKEKSASNERIELPVHTNRMPSIEVPERAVSENSEVPVNLSILTITAPLDNATIPPMGPGIFDVLADVQPPLKEEEFVELYLDSTPVGPLQKKPNWTLTYLTRGAHKLEVRRVSSSGQVLDSSAPITVFVLRPSAP
ncbi:DUF4124 domain-containing protein [Luminiphilus sp.]|nr:DUF4124 domain-containing protein [Luminiphilus sp.]